MAFVLLSQPEMTILEILEIIKWQSMWVKNKASVEVLKTAVLTDFHVKMSKSTADINMFTACYEERFGLCG